MTVLQAIILGIVEGVTEFLPVSSTGHLILASKLLGLADTSFIKSFEIIIQLGAILSVIFLYWKSFMNPETLKKLFIAFLPTSVVGLAFYKLIKTYLLGNQTVVLWSLFIGGAVLIVFELFNKEIQENTDNIKKLSCKKSFTIGLFQSIAIIPGVSRSASTILGGLILGIDRKTIVEFSFLLAVPTMLAASGLDLFKNASSFSANQFGALSVGFIASFLVALASIKFLLKFIRNHTFIPFGIYRILLAAAFWIYFF